jgi:hypothetical protein
MNLLIDYPRQYPVNFEVLRDPPYPSAPPVLVFEVNLVKALLRRSGLKDIPTNNNAVKSSLLTQLEILKFKERA